MCRNLANLCMVILGVWTVATHSAALHNDTVCVSSEVMTQLVETVQPMCDVMPYMVVCGVVNDTLSQVQQDESERSDVPTKDRLAASSPVLSFALKYFASIQQHNRALMEKDAYSSARLTTLEREKARLEERLSMLEGQQGHVRTARDTQNSLPSPLEASTHNLETVYNPSTGHSSQAANILRPTDCSDYLVLGYKTSGVYKIYPFRCRCSKPVKVWCDMETDGGGWTVFLARSNDTEQENFNRGWNDYRDGFGNASGEYWLGNENIFVMTNSRKYKLRMDFVISNGDLKWGEWPLFQIQGEETRYKLQASTYNANSMIDNCLTPQNNRLFSTFDNDNDGSSGTNCAQVKKGGWWYSTCKLLDPTGHFTPEGTLKISCPYKVQNLKIPMVGHWLQMKIRPSTCDTNAKSVYFNGYSCHDHNS